MKSSGYSISQYHEVKPIYNKLKELVAKPALGLDDKYLSKVLGYFDKN